MTPPGFACGGGKERPILFSGPMVRALLDGTWLWVVSFRVATLDEEAT